MNLPHDPSEEKCGDWWFRHVTAFNKALIGVRDLVVGVVSQVTWLLRRGGNAGALFVVLLSCTVRIISMRVCCAG